MTRRPTIAAFVVLCAAIVLWRGLRSNVREAVASETSQAESLPLEHASEAAAIQAPTLTSERTAASEAALSKDSSELRATEGDSKFRLFGSVVQADGQLFGEPQTALALTSRSGKRQLTWIDSGRYAFEGLQAGSYVLSSRRPGYKILERNVVIDVADQKLDLTIERAWTIDVHLVTPDGEDLRSRLQKIGVGVFLDQPSILCTRDPLGDRLPPSFQTNHSREGLSVPAMDPETGMDSDRIYVQGGPPIQVSVLLRDLVLASRRVTTLVSELTFEISVDQIRSLLSGFTVKLVNGDTDLPATEGRLHVPTSGRMGLRPDEQGRVRLRDQLPGRYEIVAFLHGFPLERRVIELQPGVETDLGTIIFGKGFLVSGRCVDEKGDPKRVPMALTPIEDVNASAAEASSMLFDVRTEDDGRFSAKRLASGRYLLRVRTTPVVPKGDGEPGWSARPVLVDTSHGSVEDLVVVVSRPLQATLRPTSPDVSGMRYQVLDLDGLVVAGGKFTGTAAVVVDLVKGDYTLRVLRDGSRIRDLPLQIAGETTTVEIDP